MSNDEATTILTGLLAAFPNAEIQDATPDIWRRYLHTISFEVADKAVARCVMECRFFPTIAEFRDFVSIARREQPSEPKRGLTYEGELAQIQERYNRMKARKHAERTKT